MELKEREVELECQAEDHMIMTTDLTAIRELDSKDVEGDPN
jgi:hypothetical protein